MNQQPSVPAVPRGRVLHGEGTAPSSVRLVRRHGGRAGLSERSIGYALVAHGMIGVALLVPAVLIMAALLLGQQEIAARGSWNDTLARAEVTLGDGAAAARNARSALAASSASAATASDLLDELATTMHEGAGSLRIEILGERPFVGLADSFDRTGDRAAASASAIDAAVPEVAETAGTMDRLSADLDDLSAQLARLRSASPVGPPIIVLGALGTLLLVWLASVSIMLIVLGRRLIRREGLG